MSKIEIPHTAHKFLAAIATGLFVGLAFVGGVTIQTLRSGVTPLALTATVENFPTKPLLSPNVLIAKSAILFDPTDGRILFQKNADVQHPLASLTKLMTTTVILSNENPASTTVTITPQDLEPGGDWTGGLKVGQVVSVQKLLHLALIASSNDAMQAAVSSLGDNYLQKMNQTAQELGLTKTYFLNPTGLDISTSTSGAYGSAYDIARLATYFYAHYPNYFELSQHGSVSIDDSGHKTTGHATAAPLLSIPGFIAAKTGYTDLAGGNLVVVFDVEINHPLVAVVLGSTFDGRFEDMKTLINAVRQSK